ncbi:MAG: cysteine protease [Prevotella sp.]|nr:cysteine protease [Prevotella sp.]
MKLTAIFLLLLLSVVLVAGCSRPTARKDTDGATAADSAAQVTDHGARGDVARHIMAVCRRHGVTVTQLLPVTPVKNQGRSDLCWVYAALAAIESTHAAAGDSVNLSPDYLARNMLMRQARLNWLSRGRHDMSMRGTLPMALHLLREDGAMPYDSYSTPSPINWRATSRRAVLAANCEPTFDRAERAVATCADNAVGSVPPHVFMLGAEYSPVDFAQSVCRSDEWHMFTSFTHHPFGCDIQLELADNQFGDTFHNVPLDTLIHLLDRSLDNARAVGWEGDISEEGFRWAAGVADVPRTVACTQQERQRQFDRRLTTDDHCLTIVGRAVSRRGTRYYIAKNSWGATNALRGFILLSERYVRMKTVALMVGAE